MNYVDNTTQEIMRICSPVAHQMRKLDRPIKFGDDFTLEASEEYPVTALISPFVINLDKRVWGEDADRFRPERFDNPPENKYSFQTFSHGRRDCVGKVLAIPQLKAQFCYLVKNFKMSLKEGEESVYTRPKSSDIMIRFKKEPVLVFEKR